MSIRLRYYLAILPLFLGVALLNGLLVYTLDRQEIRWGLQQRAEGSAAVLAGFWPSLQQESVERQRAKLRAFSRRLGGLAISAFDAQGNPRVLLAQDDLYVTPPDQPALAALAAGGLGWRWQERGDQASDLNIGYARIDDGNGAVLVAVAEADKTLREATAALTQRLITLSIIMLLAGVLVAEWLTRFARRELGALGRAASQLAGGQPLQQWPTGRIRELNDLGGTLLTMASLLTDGSHQTRRRFFEAELLPGDADLAAALRSSVLPDALPEALAERCAWQFLGAPLAGEFFGQRRAAHGWWLVTGLQRADSSQRSELQHSLAALATRDYVLESLATGYDQAAVHAVLELFPCSVLQLLWLPDSGAAQGWNLDPLSQQLQAFQPRRRFAMIGTVPREAIRLARSYEGQFPQRALKQAMDEVGSLLEGSHRGILIIAEARHNASEATPA